MWGHARKPKQTHHSEIIADIFFQPSVSHKNKVMFTTIYDKPGYDDYLELEPLGADTAGDSWRWVLTSLDINKILRCWLEQQVCTRVWIHNFSLQFICWTCLDVTHVWFLDCQCLIVKGTFPISSPSPRSNPFNDQHGAIGTIIEPSTSPIKRGDSSINCRLSCNQAKLAENHPFNHV